MVYIINLRCIFFYMAMRVFDNIFSELFIYTGILKYVFCIHQMAIVIREIHNYMYT